MTDWKKEAESLIADFAISWDDQEILNARIEALARKAWNEAVEEASRLSKKAEYDCYGLCAKLILSLKHKEPEK